MNNYLTNFVCLKILYIENSNGFIFKIKYHNYVFFIKYLLVCKVLDQYSIILTINGKI